MLAYYDGAGRAACATGGNYWLDPTVALVIAAVVG